MKFKIDTPLTRHTGEAIVDDAGKAMTVGEALIVALESQPFETDGRGQRAPRAITMAEINTRSALLHKFPAGSAVADLSVDDIRTLQDLAAGCLSVPVNLFLSGFFDSPLPKEAP